MTRYKDSNGEVLGVGSDMPHGGSIATESEILANEAQRLEALKPKSITPLQARLELSSMGIRQAVENAMLTATQDIKDFYEFAQEWKRDNVQLIQMATDLAMSDADIDNFFLRASVR